MEKRYLGIRNVILKMCNMERKLILPLSFRLNLLLHLYLKSNTLVTQPPCLHKGGFRGRTCGMGSLQVWRLWYEWGHLYIWMKYGREIKCVFLVCTWAICPSLSTPVQIWWSRQNRALEATFPLSAENWIFRRFNVFNHIWKISDLYWEGWYDFKNACISLLSWFRAYVDFSCYTVLSR